MRAAILLLLFGCASSGPAPVTGRPPGPTAAPAPAPAPPKDPTGDEVVDAAIDTYAALATYRDAGTVTTQFVGKPDAERATFTTTYARTAPWFAFAFHGDKGDFGLYADRDHAYAQTPSKVEDYGGQLDDAQAVLLGPTALTSSLVPAMLRGGRALLDSIDDPQLVGREALDGRATYHVTGKAGAERTLDVWFDVRSHLVVKFVEHAHLERANLDVTHAITYAPEANPALDAATFAPPAFAQAPVVVAQPSWVGVRLEPNARVKLVIPSSPAERAGIRQDDRVVSVDGAATPDATEATLRLRNAKLGAPLAVVVERAGAKRTITVTPERMPDPLGMIRAALVGKPAADLDANMRGAVVILDFWATWCKPCLVTMPRLDKLAQKYAARGLRVVGYTDEGVAQIADYRAKHPISYALQQDANSEIANHYLVQGIPQLVVIDRKGIVRAVDVGAGNLRDVERLVKSLL